MNYKETLSWLYSHLPMYQRIGAAAYKANLDNTIALCNLLGNPQNSFRSVHVAGTNGKGSVSHMLASILQEHGLKTGLYTSPHLKDFRERIRVNGSMIPKRNVTRFINKYREAFEEIRPSFFEMTVGLAFEHFRQESVDIAVVEVGMGGRLDSTNIITPLVSVITNISFDHMQFLGDTLEKIAIEKAGIIKPGIPVVIGETQPELESLFRKRARQVGSKIVFADQLPRYEIRDARNAIQDPASSIQDPLHGHYQKKNIITSLGVINLLNQTGYKISKKSIHKGIRNVTENTGLQGRWQVLSQTPLTICDIGHNEAGIREVVQQLSKTPHQQLHMVFGLVNDKEISHILHLLPTEATCYFCKADIPRGLDAKELHIQAEKQGLKGTFYRSVREALTAARNTATPDDLIFIGGSTFVVAEALP
ncbi:MAG: bifunctional folylpolyglutamate synthase/dihydrofolate synthase [Bacteroidales bacterium]|nr:bifunctional folylpolyglutamate synthase/dihydrofolate synthase [Bacteroidales bacterium]